MLTQHVATSDIQDALLEYFAGERREILLVLAITLAVAVLTLCLFISTRGRFALALMITVLVFGGLMSSYVIRSGLDDGA